MTTQKIDRKDFKWHTTDSGRRYLPIPLKTTSGQKQKNQYKDIVTAFRKKGMNANNDPYGKIIQMTWCPTCVENNIANRGRLLVQVNTETGEYACIEVCGNKGQLSP